MTGRLHPTAIQWATHAVNPFVAVNRETGRQGWTCTRIAPGCTHCYAATLNRFRGTGHDYDVRGNAAVDVQFDDAAIASVLSRRKPATIFWCDMTDMFHALYPNGWISRCFAAMALTPHLKHIVLTKRPDRALDYVTQAMRAPSGWYVAACELDNWRAISTWPDSARVPLRNIAIGVSVSTQRDADTLLPILLQIPAALRFVSLEPQIERVDLRRAIAEKPGLDFVIIGGESGRAARPFEIGWAPETIRQCETAGIAVGIKQFGSRPYDGPVSSGRAVKLRDSHGGDPAEWPADLQPYAITPESWPWRGGGGGTQVML